MTLAQFALLVAAEPKWVQNARRLLERSAEYTEDEARHLGLVYRLQTSLSVPLEVADRLAAAALAAWPGERLATIDMDQEGCVRVQIDLARYLSDFTVRLSRLRASWAPRKRGPSIDWEGGDALARAREWGLDIGLLRTSLARSPAERLKALDENQRFVERLREAGVS